MSNTRLEWQECGTDVDYELENGKHDEQTILSASGGRARGSQEISDFNPHSQQIPPLL